jgi:periplasmic protein TonB
MDFSQAADDPRRHLWGLGIVVLLHVLVIYALVNGLAQKVMEVVRTPVEVRLIDEITPAPPPPPSPPPAAVVAPPKRQLPPPVIVPPPEVEVAAPAQVAPTITASPPAPLEVSPAPPPAAIESAAPASGVGRPQVVAAGIACTRTPPPVAPAVSSEVRGSLFVIGTLKAGRVVQVDIDRNTLKGVPDRRTLRAFINAVEVAMKEGYVCNGDGVQIRQEFFFDIR